MGKPIIGAPRRRRQDGFDSVHELRVMLSKDPLNPRLVAAYFCVQCVGNSPDTIHEIRRCTKQQCCGWRIRAWQRDVEPRSAPHHEYRGLAGFDSPDEPPEIEIGGD